MVDFSLPEETSPTQNLKSIKKIWVSYCEASAGSYEEELDWVLVEFSLVATFHVVALGL